MAARRKRTKQTAAPERGNAPSSAVRRGRRPVVGVSRLLKDLRTKAWASAVRDAVAAALGVNGVTGWVRVDREVGERLRNVAFAEQYRFQRYAKGLIHPNETTLAIIERHFPGTRDVNEYGPGRSYLWSALGPEPAAALGALEREWRGGVVVRDTGEVPARSLYRVVPKTMASRQELTNRGFPRVDVRDLLQPWQRVDDYLGRWVSINAPLPGRQTLPIRPEPQRSVYRARLGVNNARNAVAMPSLASLSYSIAHARCFDESLRVDLDLLVRCGISAQAVRALLSDAALS